MSDAVWQLYDEGKRDWRTLRSAWAAAFCLELGYELRLVDRDGAPEPDMMI